MFFSNQRKKNTLLGNTEGFHVFDVCADSLIFLCPAIN